MTSLRLHESGRLPAGGDCATRVFADGGDVTDDDSIDPASTRGRIERADRPIDSESPYKSVGGMHRVWNATRYSMRGLALAWRIESAFRQELALAVVLTPIAFLLTLSPFETLVLIGSTVMVLIVELLNSSIEAAVDRISLDHHHLAGRAKDLGSAAVFLSLLLCFATWLVIAGPAVVARLERFTSH